MLRPLMTTAGYTTKGRFWEWVPASYDKLEQVERKIWEKAMPSTPFEMTKVAKLGTVIVPCTDKEKVKNGKVDNLVLVHGFAGGNAVWAMNLAALAQHFNVYAVEWIGVARSDRPDFPYKDFDSANEFVLSSFENWRKELELDKFHLCAHSMGLTTLFSVLQAIFASSYAIQNPQNVNHLLLVSPAGVSRPPIPDPDSALERARRSSWVRRMAISAWENGVTPMSIARFVGPYGPQLVSNVLTRRISFMPQTSALRSGSVDLNDLSEYIYHNWALKASGEKTMTTHLAPGAYAVRPLTDMLQPETVPMPLTFIYGGESDWMDFRHGKKIVERFRASGRDDTDLYLVPFCGHQVFLDNPVEFNRTVVEAIVKA
ncbi:Cleavage induced serine protease family s33, partial [Globisporangium splendens]